jgi:hypothetical protein
MNSNEFDRERRKQRAFERFGTDHPICAACGNDDWRCLERHHIAGRHADDACAILCGACHAIMTDGQNDHPPRREIADPSLDRVGRFLLGLADLLRLAAEKLQWFGRELIERARPMGNSGEAA